MCREVLSPREEIVLGDGAIGFVLEVADGLLDQAGALLLGGGHGLALVPVLALAGLLGRVVWVLDDAL